jgi:hypothetical protein
MPKKINIFKQIAFSGKLFYQLQFQSQVFNNIEVTSSLIQLNSCLFADRCIFLLQQQLNQQSLNYIGEPVFG